VSKNGEKKGGKGREEEEGSIEHEKTGCRFLHRGTTKMIVHNHPDGGGENKQKKKSWLSSCYNWYHAGKRSIVKSH